MSRNAEIDAYKNELYDEIACKEMAEIYAIEHPAYYGDAEVARRISAKGIPTSKQVIARIRKERGFPDVFGRRQYNESNRGREVD